VLQEKERPVVDARQTGAEPAAEPLRLGLRLDGVVDLLPLDPERRVRKQVVEPLAVVVVL
jgi:hypothetical protein